MRAWTDEDPSYNDGFEMRDAVDNITAWEKLSYFEMDVGDVPFTGGREESREERMAWCIARQNGTAPKLSRGALKGNGFFTRS